MPSGKAREQDKADRKEGPDPEKKLLSLREEGMRLFQFGNYEEARKVLEKLLSSMEEGGASADDSAYVMAYLSCAYRILGDVDKSELMAKKAMELIKGANVATIVKAEVYYAHGSNFIRKVNRSVGMKHLERALSLFEMIKEREGQARTCRTIGMGHVFDGNNSKAIVYFRKAHGLFNELGNTKEAAQTLGNLAVAKAEEGMYEEAVEDMKGVLVLAKGSKASTLQAGTLLNIAMTYLFLDRPGEALTYCDQGLAIATAIKDTRMTATLLMSKVEVLLRLGRLDEAGSLLDEHFKMAIGIKTNDLQGYAFKVRGTMFREKGDLRRAQDDYSSAEKFFVASEQKGSLADLYMEWAIAAHKAREDGKAKVMAEKARAIYKRARVPLREKWLDRVLKKHGM